MKITTTVVIFILSFCAFGQSSHEGFRNFKTDSVFKLDTNGLSQITLPDLTLCVTNDGSWHVQDLNFDGKNDLIYSGSCDPYVRTIIYIKTDTGFYNMNTTTGFLHDTKVINGESHIKVIKEACCCDYYSEFGTIKIDSASHLSFDWGYVIHQDTEFHDLKTPLQKKVSGVIRTTPNINDLITSDPCTGEMIKGNRLNRIDNETVFILKETDNWYLIIHQISNEQSIIGWIEREE